MPGLTENEKLTRLLWNATRRAVAKVTEARSRLALAEKALDKVERMVERRLGEASGVVVPVNVP